MKHFLYILTILSLCILTGCEGDAVYPGGDTAEHSVEIRLGMPQSTAAYVSVPDPGTDHGEWNENWTQMAVFFVYSDRNTVSAKVLTKEEFDALEGGATSVDKNIKLIRLSIPTGTVEAIYAVAFAAPQTIDERSAGNMTPAEVRNFATMSLTDAAFSGSDVLRKEYMMSLLSGKTTVKFTFEKDADGNSNANEFPATTVTLQRVAAKIDVQYDMAAAYEGSVLKDPTMSAIRFYGANQGYFFPTEADKGTDYATTYGYTPEVDSDISERNGRMVFYAMPEVKNKFDFKVTYNGSNETTVTATFNNNLAPATWHKVNLTVSGSRIGGASTSVDLIIDNPVEPVE